jgi:hypothetical protein
MALVSSSMQGPSSFASYTGGIGEDRREAAGNDFLGRNAKQITVNKPMQASTKITKQAIKTNSNQHTE